MKFLSALKWGIGFKLGVLLATFGILATGMTGYYFYMSSRTLLVSAAERDLLTATQVVGRNMSLILDVIAEDARMLAAIPASRHALDSLDDQVAERDKKALTDIFSAMLSVHPEYFQVRLIGADRHGLEVVRITRNGNELIRAMAGDLQEKAHFPYVFDTLRLGQGDIYLSDITINHEEGAHSGRNKPTLTASTPVIAGNGKVLGLIVINIDLDGLSRLLKTNLPGTYQLYLANQWGDFLIHPDAAQTFGFDQGRRVFVQDTFKPVAALVQGESLNVVMNVKKGELRNQDGNIAAFTRLPFGDDITKRFVILGLSQPLDSIARETARLGWNTIQIVLAFSGFALALSMLISRVVTGPLNTIVGAIKLFSKEHVIRALPLKRNDELGLLSRSFNDMQMEIMAHLSELNESRKALDNLSRHDALTGLPNRRMFFDRLEQAIANSRRSGKQFAVLYVDLDRFKEINDSLGHGIGDAVLVAVANLIKSALREVDTVARLGGDEFVVLLDTIDDAQHVTTIVQKLHDCFQGAILIERHELHIRASMGVSLFSNDGQDADELIHNADQAMYYSKNEGRNIFKFHA